MGSFALLTSVSHGDNSVGFVCFNSCLSMSSFVHMLCCETLVND